MTTTASELAWSTAAARLADQLAAAGKLTDPAWRAALTAVPRHHLVPRYYNQDPVGAHRHHRAATRAVDGTGVREHGPDHRPAPHR